VWLRSNEIKSQNAIGLVGCATSKQGRICYPVKQPLRRCVLLSIDGVANIALHYFSTRKFTGFI